MGKSRTLRQPNRFRKRRQMTPTYTPLFISFFRHETLTISLIKYTEYERGWWFRSPNERISLPRKALYPQLSIKGDHTHMTSNYSCTAARGRQSSTALSFLIFLFFPSWYTNHAISFGSLNDIRTRKKGKQERSKPTGGKL